MTALAGAGLALLVGCSEDSPPPPVEFGAAKPAGDRLGLTPPAGASLPLAQWPDGCKLLTDAEVTAILPQAENVEREPVKVTILNFDPLSEAAPGTTGDVPSGGCKFTFDLPGNSGGASSATVTVTALADASLTAQKYDEDKQDDSSEKGFKDLNSSWGAESCYLFEGPIGAEITCRQGPYVFELDGSSHAEGLAPNPGPDAKPSENLAAAAKREQVWTDKVLSQVARTVAARMS
ncbi:hypothetical protein HUT18_15205 [Streptomyces sp. NA04227]|uniref:hypothetical protein n=1 Tax=Streptomyces sp. NA04227 TaxID=2742136 RepID=UPI00159207E9|nr:hypothetical protein [Streptomyces sp. NA04227]QKW07528.1 hypothetical protein HUT18_15205 [Streptomyces sp. NA04227]